MKHSRDNWQLTVHISEIATNEKYSPLLFWMEIWSISVSDSSFYHAWHAMLWQTQLCYVSRPSVHLPVFDVGVPWYSFEFFENNYVSFSLK